MMIGTSLGKCLKDILDGTVKEDEVLVIVSNTRCPDLPRLIDVVDQYYHGRQFVPDYDLTAHTLEAARSLAQRLFESGKLHQPRCHLDTGNAHHLKDTWYEIVPTNSSHNPNVIDAYEKYRLLVNLTQ